MIEGLANDKKRKSYLHTPLCLEVKKNQQAEDGYEASTK